MNFAINIKSKDGSCISIHDNHKILKLDYFKNVNLEEYLSFEYKTLWNLIHFNFKEFNYSYSDMIEHAKVTFHVKYKEHNNKWDSYFKYIILNHPELYYYKYHIYIFFEDHSCDYIIKNYPTFNSFFDMIICQSLKTSEKPIKNIQNNYRNIINHENLVLRESNMYSDFEKNFYKKLASDPILIYNIIKDKSFCIQNAVRFIPFLNNEMFDFLLSKYDIIHFLKFDEKMAESY